MPLLIGSTCFGHYYAHHQELATIMLITTFVVSFFVWCRLEVSLQPTSNQDLRLRPRGNWDRHIWNMKVEKQSSLMILVFWWRFLASLYVTCFVTYLVLEHNNIFTKSRDEGNIFFFCNATTCSYRGFRPGCGDSVADLRLGRPWGATTLSRWCEWWYAGRWRQYMLWNLCVSIQVTHSFFLIQY